jgi:2-phosphoglycerate kinase
MSSSAAGAGSGAGRKRVVVVRSNYGLPYSKGLMAQSITATGLPPERSFALARMIEERLSERDETEVSVAELKALAEEVLLAEEAEPVATRFRQWWRLGSLDRPLVVLLGGVTGVGKSTVASQLANRLGITRVVATDQVRQVVRAFFSHDFMPAVHHSSFDVANAMPSLGDGPAATVSGFRLQVEEIAPGIDALVERAVSEQERIVIEGVHLLPEVPDARLCEQAVTARVLLAVRDERAHRAHFHMRGLQAPRPPERYLEAFDRIRTLQAYLIERAEKAGTPIIDEGGLEPTLKRVMEVVLDAVGPGEVTERGAGGNVSKRKEIRR